MFTGDEVVCAYIVSMYVREREKKRGSEAGRNLVNSSFKTRNLSMRNTAVSFPSFFSSPCRARVSFYPDFLLAVAFPPVRLSTRTTTEEDLSPLITRSITRD
ncbi:hypothetical protein ALC53_09459 [Atta colombica]|uniref:Uncharacterized protein n=1 Tax=Atta colombica TaxID=520822 RepID=A0A195B7Z6_9HYME|nr:hypothetical protein ALC53_09459 [Atta colombica]